MNAKWLTNFLLVVVVLSSTACGPADPAAEMVSNSNKMNLQRLANLYTLYQQQNKFDGPVDEAGFKEFIKQTDARRLEVMGIDPSAIDQLFVSERDGEPFKIKYGIRSGPHGCQEPAIFESTGSGGKRMVGFLNMVQREVESSEYDQLFTSEPADDAAIASRRPGDR